MACLGILQVADLCSVLGVGRSQSRQSDGGTDAACCTIGDVKTLYFCEAAEREAFPRGDPPYVSSTCAAPALPPPQFHVIHSALLPIYYFYWSIASSYHYDVLPKVSRFGERVFGSICRALGIPSPF